MVTLGFLPSSKLSKLCFISLSSGCQFRLCNFFFFSCFVCMFCFRNPSSFSSCFFSRVSSLKPTSLLALKSLDFRFLFPKFLLVHFRRKPPSPNLFKLYYFFYFINPFRHSLAAAATMTTSVCFPLPKKSSLTQTLAHK